MSLIDPPLLPFFSFILLLAGCSASGAMEGRIKDMERQVAELQKTTSELSSRLDEVNNGLFILKDRMEAQASGIESLRKQQAVPEKKKQPQKGSDVTRAYKHALSLYNDRDYQGSLIEFEQVIAEYPDHKLAENARYWRGECYYALKDYQQSLSEFQRVLDEYPKGNKVPDALLKMGMIYLQMDDKKQAVEHMERVIREYPYSEASKKAEERLKEITRP